MLIKVAILLGYGEDYMGEFMENFQYRVCFISICWFYCGLFEDNFLYIIKIWLEKIIKIFFKLWNRSPKFRILIDDNWNRLLLVIIKAFCLVINLFISVHPSVCPWSHPYIDSLVTLIKRMYLKCCLLLIERITRFVNVN